MDTLNNPPNLTNNEETDIKSPFYFSIPYHDEICSNFNRIFQNLNAIPAWRPSFTTRDIFSVLKDPTTLEFSSSVIYEVSCICNKKYIGETCQYLKRRVGRHRSDATGDNDSISALSQHMRESGHRPSLQHTKILHAEENLDRRRILESIYITQTSNTLNYNTDYNNIVKNYAILFEQ